MRPSKSVTEQDLAWARRNLPPEEVEALAQRFLDEQRGAEEAPETQPENTEIPTVVRVPHFEVVAPPSAAARYTYEARIAATRLLERAAVDCKMAARSPFADAETRALLRDVVSRIEDARIRVLERP